MSDLIAIDVYMLYVDKNGKRWVDHHRAIAGGRFVEITKRDFLAENPLGRCLQITRETYNKERQWPSPKSN